MPWKPQTEKTKYGRQKKNTEKGKDTFRVRINPLGRTASWQGCPPPYFKCFERESRSYWVSSVPKLSLWAPTRSLHVSQVTQEAVPPPWLSSSQRAGSRWSTWAHLKLFKFTAMWCNPAFMSPLNLSQQLMPASAVVPFAQSHSNEQNLRRGQLN